ncbi:MAG: hypothetical protein KAJ91_04525, partial [Candidatus Aenigmarchaeota archaeon]|nr:hypothetical protein [Candidatus Aenigmarchaeota archaeon]
YETTGADYASDEYFTIEKDDVRIDYIAGNETSVNKTNYTTFVLRLWDTDNNSAVSAPISTITFNITRDGTNYLVEGSNTTNSSGFVEYNFQASCVYYPGKQKWLAFLPSTDTYYKYNVSEELNVTLDMLCPEFNITNILAPSEAFQYKPFEVNISLQVVDYNATDANATISTESWSVTPSKNQHFPVIEAGVGQTVYENVMWTVNATGMTPYDYPFVINFSANTTTPASEGFYSDTDQASVTVYRLLEESCPALATNGTSVTTQLCSINANIGESLDDSAFEALLAPDTSLLSSWDCRAAEYRVANITAIWEAEGLDNSTSARVEVYNGTSWIDVSHSSPVGINASEENVFVLNNTLYASESGYCRVNITNIGMFGLYIDYLSLESYYRTTAKILDIDPQIGGASTKGIEPSEELVNFTITVDNYLNTSYAGSTLTLNITNSTGYIVNSSQQAFTLERNTTTQRNFTNINTTAWSEGIYALNAYLVYGSYTDNRAESIVLGSVKAHAQSDTYACEGNTTEFTVIVYHPFTDTISYNVTLDTPGWGYTPAWQQINATSAKNYTVSFNITPGSTTENITAVVNYTYPGSIQKSVEDNKTIEASASTSVLEIIRETPGILAADRVFSSRLVVHNKGCAATIGTTTLMEIVGSGWTPANPAVLGDVQEISSTVDLENNLVTWQLGQIQPKQYAIAAYQMKSPPTYPTTGTLNWNVSWESKQMQEASLFRMQTFNYTGESHISFDMEAWQKDEYPWTENRSMQPNITYNFSLKTRNVGDTQVSSGQWNVTLTIPASCNVTETTGSWNSTSSMITWELPALAVRSTEYLNFTLNCTL